jgi:hypothetical protein
MEGYNKVDAKTHERNKLKSKLEEVLNSEQNK